MKTLMILTCILSANAFANETTAQAWADKSIKFLTDQCDSHIILENKVRDIESKFVEEIDKIPIAQLNSLAPTSSLLELGEVLFPEHLPEGFPMRGIYLLCTDVHHAYLKSKTPAEYKEKLDELNNCFQDAYRKEQPALVRKLISCYQNIKK